VARPSWLLTQMVGATPAVWLYLDAEVLVLPAPVLLSSGLLGFGLTPLPLHRDLKHKHKLRGTSC